MKSSRLPRKALLPLAGRPLVCHLIDRMRCVLQSEGIVICTSHLPDDDEIAGWARSHRLELYRGEPDDVLARLNGAAKVYGAHTLFCVTGDNPLVDPVHADRLLDFHWANQNDYSRVTGLPIGTYGYAVAADALEEVCRRKQSPDTEIWGPYFTRTADFTCGELKVNGFPALADARLTVDEDDDYRLMKNIFGMLYEPGAIFGLAELETLRTRMPDWFAINAAVRQRAAPRPSLP